MIAGRGNVEGPRSFFTGLAILKRASWRSLSMNRIGVLAVGILLSAPLWASAKTLYVDGSTGSDSTSYAANGPSTPWRTIGRAAWGNASRSAPNSSEAARAGDTVSIVAGTYSSSLNIGGGRWLVLYDTVNDGTAGNPIVFLATGVVRIQARYWYGPVIGASEKDYIHWTGPFYLDEADILTHADTGPVVLHDSTGSGIDGATIHGAGATWADNHTGVRFEACNRCFVRNARIDNFKSLQGATSRNGAGVMLYDSDDTIIERNEIFDCGSGVYIKGAFVPPQERTIVRFNLIHDMLSQGVIVQVTQDGRVYQNIIRDNPAGIVFNAADVSPGAYPTNDIVANNTLDGNDAPVIYNTDLLENVRFWNNIVTNSPTAQYSDVQASPGDVELDRNVYFGIPSGTFARFTQGAYTFSAWRSTFLQDAHSIVGDPMYVNSGSDDFRLSPSSPVRNLGIDILDLDGDGSTTDPINPGAYVSGSESIGPGPVDPPSVPTRVRVIRP